MSVLAENPLKKPVADDDLAIGSMSEGQDGTVRRGEPIHVPTRLCNRLKPYPWTL